MLRGHAHTVKMAGMYWLDVALRASTWKARRPATAAGFTGHHSLASVSKHCKAVHRQNATARLSRRS